MSNRLIFFFQNFSENESVISKNNTKGNQKKWNCFAWVSNFFENFFQKIIKISSS